MKSVKIILVTILLFVYTSINVAVAPQTSGKAAILMDGRADASYMRTTSGKLPMASTTIMTAIVALEHGIWTIL